MINSTRFWLGLWLLTFAGLVIALIAIYGHH
jgi:hypothetical protein